jgi:beta-phosphoglucomutase-like phosphatase (HAD superfamily)
MDQDTDHTPALLFDLDGTLIDSVYQNVLAWHEALEELGLSLALWRIHRCIGMSSVCWSRLSGERITAEQAKQLQQKHAAAYEHYQATIQPSAWRS